MDTSPAADTAAHPHPLLRFHRASQAVYGTEGLDEVLTRVIAELYSTLNAEAASVALLDKLSGEIILDAAGPVAEIVSGLRLPPEYGIIGWVIANGQSSIVNDVSADPRFWSDVDGYSGFETRSVLCAPLLSGHQVIGAVEVLNKRDGEFTTEDLIFLEAFAAVAASAIESAQRMRQRQQRRREADTLRRAWEALTTPRALEELLDVILDQLAQLIEYRSATILLVTEESGLELSASRGIEDLEKAARLVSELGLDVKVQTMLKTRQPLLIPDTRTDIRWRHYPGFSHLRSWIGAPLLIKGQLIGTLNIDHDRPNYYNVDHVQLVSSFAHQAAIAIENSQLHAATTEVTSRLVEQTRRMVTLYEAIRTYLRGPELEHNALRKLINLITDLVGARYGILNILAQENQPSLLISIGPQGAEITDLDWAALEHGILGALDSEREVIRSDELQGTIGTRRSIPPTLLKSFLGVAIHTRGQLSGQLVLADKEGDGVFSRDDEALAQALATNLAGAIENASLHHKTQQRLRELIALYEISRTVTGMKETSDIYTHLATQVARLLDTERCAFFIYSEGLLECQAPGYGLEPEIIPRLRFHVKEGDPTYAIIHAPDASINNKAMEDPELETFRPLLAELGIDRLMSCRIAIDEHQVGLLVAADKRGGKEFTEQDRHLVSIMAHQVSSVLQRALAQRRQQEHAQIQSALLEVSQAISSLTNLDELLQTVAQITHRLAGCDHCLIASWEERLTAFVPRAQSGLDGDVDEALPQMLLKPSDIPFIDQATETRKPILLTARDIREKIPAWTQGLLGSENSLVVPLVIQERVVGLIDAAYVGKKAPPGQREIALVTGIARQAAVAIENANLYHDLQLHAARLERAYSDLKELDARKTQFIQNVSHELRTPFTLIKGYLELLLDGEMGALSERQKEGVLVIEEKTEALGKLINDIISVQNIDASSLDLHVFDLSRVVHTAVANIKAAVPDADLQCDLPPDLPPVKADANMVERVLNFLLENAIKFSPDGGAITVRASPKNGMMRIEVEDHGIGIPATALPYIFDRFYQVDGSTTRRFGGTGLGLSIARQIVRAHDGEVDVESTEGHGSTFHFTLPLASQADLAS
jgi:GAF domain-containing protein/anti-sigma regulatory factor (Ser/Thr protein kinase)